MSAAPDAVSISLAPVVCVAVVDDRKLLAAGLRSLLNAYRGVEVLPEDELPTGGVALVGLCKTPYLPRPGIRLARLDVTRSADELVRELRRSGGEMRRPSRRQGQALSASERQILDMTADGSSAVQIAHSLGVSPRTVERHRRSLGEKLAARSSSHAVAVGALNEKERQAPVDTHK